MTFESTRRRPTETGAMPAVVRDTIIGSRRTVTVIGNLKAPSRPATLSARAQLIPFTIFVDLFDIPGGTDAVDDLDYKAELQNVPAGSYLVIVRHSVPRFPAAQLLQQSRVTVPD